MSTFDQIREGMTQAWGSLMEGWRQLYTRAAGAMTRFRPRSGTEDPGGELLLRSAGWGVLAGEVYDGDDEVVVRIEAPGMEPGDFDLQVVEDALVISGEKQLQRERSEGRYRLTECAYGSFRRVLPLPDEVDADRARASYRRGVLRIELPRASSRRRRSIKVDVR